MDNHKGYSLVELLVVIVIIALILFWVTFAIVGEINKARGNTIISHARMAHTAALAVLLESRVFGEDISDEEYAAGLTGRVNSVSRPAETRLSKRINALLEPDIVLSVPEGKGVAGTVEVEFIVKDGKIISMTYSEIVSGRVYAVKIEDGETTVLSG